MQRGLAACGLMLATACGRLGFDATTSSTTSDAAASGSGDGALMLGDGAVRPGAGSTTTFAEGYGGTGNDDGYDVSVLPDGRVAVVGAIQSTTPFMVGGQAIASAGGEDIFLALYAADGTPLWAKAIGSTGGDRGQGVIAEEFSIYICGLFAGTVDFGNGMGRTAAGMWDVFVAKFDTLGNLGWVTTVGGVGADFAYDLAIDAGGALVVTGYYEGAVDFGDGPLTAYGQRDVFVAKFDRANGALVWSRGFGSAANDAGQGIASDAQDNLVIGGALGGPIDFGGGAVGAAGGSFALELSPTGGHRWSRGLDGTVVWDVDVHRPSGRTLLGARLSAATDLGLGPIPAPNGTDDALLVSLAQDRSLEWYRTFGGGLSDVGLGIAVDDGGNSYMIGLGGDAIDFGAGVVSGSGVQDIFITSHDASGALRWGRLIGGATQDRGYGAAVAPDGAVWFTGRYAGTADFGTGSLSAGASDIFLLRVQ